MHFLIFAFRCQARSVKGVSAEPLCGVGVLTALVVADLTNGTGRFNLAQGLVGTASGVGASVSTALFGVIAVSFGRTVVFLSIAASALVAVLILWFLMPETRPATKPLS
jgi:sugar phosphate permease